MSRHEADREDLLREATALVERAELRIPGEAQQVTVGFRRDGSLSVFFGADPVYQFNASGQLRRAFVNGLLYKAEQGRLVALRRERTATEVALVRSEVPLVDEAAFLNAARDKLLRIDGALKIGQFQLIGQVPADADVLARLGKWLASLPVVISVARIPNAR